MAFYGLNKSGLTKHVTVQFKVWCCDRWTIWKLGESAKICPRCGKQMEQKKT